MQLNISLLNEVTLITKICADLIIITMHLITCDRA